MWVSTPSPTAQCPSLSWRLIVLWSQYQSKASAWSGALKLQALCFSALYRRGAGGASRCHRGFTLGSKMNMSCPFHGWNPNSWASVLAAPLSLLEVSVQLPPSWFFFCLFWSIPSSTFLRQMLWDVNLQDFICLKCY